MLELFGNSLYLDDKLKIQNAPSFIKAPKFIRMYNSQSLSDLSNDVKNLLLEQEEIMQALRIRKCDCCSNLYILSKKSERLKKVSRWEGKPLTCSKSCAGKLGKIQQMKTLEARKKECELSTT